MVYFSSAVIWRGSKHHKGCWWRKRLILRLRHRKAQSWDDELPALPLPSYLTLKRVLLEGTFPEDHLKCKKLESRDGRNLCPNQFEHFFFSFMQGCSTACQASAIRCLAIKTLLLSREAQKSERARMPPDNEAFESKEESHFDAWLVSIKRIIYCNFIRAL